MIQNKFEKFITIKKQFFFKLVLTLYISFFAMNVQADTGTVFYTLTEIHLRNKTAIQGLSLAGSDYTQFNLTCFTDFNEGYKKNSLPSLECINPFLQKQSITPELKNFITFQTNSNLGDGGSTAITVIENESGICQERKIPFTEMQKIVFYTGDMKRNKEKIESIKKQCKSFFTYPYISGNIEQGTGDWPGKSLLFWQDQPDNEINNAAIEDYKKYNQAVIHFWKRCEQGSIEGNEALETALLNSSFAFDKQTKRVSKKYAAIPFFLSAIDALNNSKNKKGMERMINAYKTCSILMDRYMEQSNEKNTYWQMLRQFIQANLSKNDRQPYEQLLEQLNSTR